eukprot:UN22464
MVYRSRPTTRTTLFNLQFFIVCNFISTFYRVCVDNEKRAGLGLADLLPRRLERDIQRFAPPTKDRRCEFSMRENVGFGNISSIFLRGFASLRKTFPVTPLRPR